MSKRSSLLKELRVEIRQRLSAARFAPDHADRAASIVVDTLREIYGGDAIYIPRGDETRDWQVWDEFNGHNHLELAKKFGITERHVYNIIAAIRPLAVAKEQGNLFENLEETYES